MEGTWTARTTWSSGKNHVFLSSKGAAGEMSDDASGEL